MMKDKIYESTMLQSHANALVMYHSLDPAEFHEWIKEHGGYRKVDIAIGDINGEGNLNVKEAELVPTSSLCHWLQGKLSYDQSSANDNYRMLIKFIGVDAHFLNWLRLAFPQVAMAGYPDGSEQWNRLMQIADVDVPANKYIEVLKKYYTPEEAIMFVNFFKMWAAKSATTEEHILELNKITEEWLVDVQNKFYSEFPELKPAREKKKKKKRTKAGKK